MSGATASMAGSRSVPARTSKSCRMLMPLPTSSSFQRTGPVAREDILRWQWCYGHVNIGVRMRQAVHKKKGQYGVMAFDADAVYGVTEDHEFNWQEKRIWARMLTIRSDPFGEGEGWAVKADASALMRTIVSTADALVLALRPGTAGNGELWLLSKADGKKRASIPVPGVPRWDGLAVAESSLFVATEDGKVVCYGEE